jgi:hypothetical protein
MTQQIQIPNTAFLSAGLGLSFLTDLSPEIRSMAYEHLLELSSPITPRCRNGTGAVVTNPFGARGHTKVKNTSGLLGTCRQLYHKAISVLYVRNTFIFERISECYPWLSECIKFATEITNQSKSRLEYLQRVVISMDSECFHECRSSGQDYTIDAHGQISI